MEKLRLVAWKDADERAERVRALGYDVDASPAPMPFRGLASDGTRGRDRPDATPLAGARERLWDALARNANVDDV